MASGALFRGQAKPSTFIYGVALKRALSWTRNERAYQRRHVELDESVTRARGAVPQESQSAQEQRIEQLYADRLLALLYPDDLGYREIAEVLGDYRRQRRCQVERVKKRLADRLLLGDRGCSLSVWLG
jgi:RNA polymerase sigma-70 factor (ECF subfamily)